MIRASYAPRYAPKRYAPKSPPYSLRESPPWRASKLRAKRQSAARHAPGPIGPRVARTPDRSEVASCS